MWLWAASNPNTIVCLPLIHVAFSSSVNCQSFRCTGSQDWSVPRVVQLSLNWIPGIPVYLTSPDGVLLLTKPRTDWPKGLPKHCVWFFSPIRVNPRWPVRTRLDFAVQLWPIVTV